MNKNDPLFGYSFSEPSLEELAYTHASCNAARGDNQRLEFLGDAVLDLVIAGKLYQSLPSADEGALDRARALLVNGKSLAAVARSIGLAERIAVSESQRQHHPEPSNSMLEDCFEALVGALFLDGGLEAASNFIDAAMGSQIEATTAAPLRPRPKSRLQEWCQSQHLDAMPEYELIESEGPDHQRRYRVCVRFNGDVLGEGGGSSIKAAESAAAAKALERLMIHD